MIMKIAGPSSRVCADAAAFMSQTTVRQLTIIAVYNENQSLLQTQSIEESSSSSFGFTCELATVTIVM